MDFSKISKTESQPGHSLILFFKFLKFWANLRLMSLINKAGYTATPVACGWAGAIFEVTGTFGQER